MTEQETNRLLHLLNKCVNRLSEKYENINCFYIKIADNFSSEDLNETYRYLGLRCSDIVIPNSIISELIELIFETFTGSTPLELSNLKDMIKIISNVEYRYFNDEKELQIIFLSSKKEEIKK